MLITIDTDKVAKILKRNVGWVEQAEDLAKYFKKEARKGDYCAASGKYIYCDGREKDCKKCQNFIRNFSPADFIKKCGKA